jgi:hypothetical protein
MGCYIAAASTRFVFGRTTLARHVSHSIWGWLGCCATLSAKIPCSGTVLVWRSLVFVIVSTAFDCFTSLEYIADFDLITGNNYSISNESRTKNARIFFAQGCEIVPEMVSQSAAE